MVLGLEEKGMESIVEQVVREFCRKNLLPMQEVGSGIFPTVDLAVSAAEEAQKHLRQLNWEKRETIIRALRQNIRKNAQVFADEAVKETGMGRVEDKHFKHLLVADKTPGTEDIAPRAFSGDRGLTIIEMGPYGVIGAVTPATNPCATVMNNSIGMIAAGNGVVFSVHPRAKKVSMHIIDTLNKAIVEVGGPNNLITTVLEPSLENTDQLLAHPGINMLVATGGPEIVKKVMSSGKKAIGAGAGNPPVVVDETANLEHAAKSIVAGASFDNNLPCIAEKEIIVVDYVADQLKKYILQNGAFEIKGNQVDQLKRIILSEKQDEKHAGCTVNPKKYTVNKEYIGKDAKEILKVLGIDVDRSIRLIVCETDSDHPFVQEELMMPVLPLVRVKDVAEAIDLAVKVEHGNRHTAIMHSKNVDNLTSLARAIDTTIFVKNGPSYAGIGAGGEGYTTFTIAGPTGEGLTSAKDFCRSRKCVLVDGFSIV